LNWEWGLFFFHSKYSFFSKEDNLQWKHPTHNLISWYLGNSLEVDNVMTSWFQDLKFYHLWRCDK
jgi:hypothetical protein